MYHIKNSKALTLIELLAVISIASIAVVLATSLIITSIKKYNEISAENALRDEADLIMAKIYNNLYQLKESSIWNKDELLSSSGADYITYVPNQTASSSTCTDLNMRKIGLTGTNEISLLHGGKYLLQNRKISIVSFSLSQSVDGQNLGLYEINLELKQNQKNLSRKFKNEVRTIFDL